MLNRLVLNTQCDEAPFPPLTRSAAIVLYTRIHYIELLLHCRLYTSAPGVAVKASPSSHSLAPPVKTTISLGNAGCDLSTNALSTADFLSNE